MLRLPPLLLIVLIGRKVPAAEATLDVRIVRPQVQLRQIAMLDGAQGDKTTGYVHG
jgi:hypothetical protein